MTKLQKIMTRAWEIAREAVENFGGKVVEYIAEAMKMAWAETKVAVSDIVINRLLVRGGKRWSKGNHDRLYLNRSARDLANVKVEYNKKGKWESQTLNGEYISNSRYGKLVDKINNAYIDIKTGILYLDTNYDDDAAIAEANILANLAKLA